ncbi:DNA cytosine methyltransferase [Ralstonia insidiosa]|uniref:DNA cytosine methyltransferase n=1 Tax=Ralstonia insidiosa TaxID=190721 RepID=UPI001ABFDA6D
MEVPVNELALFAGAGGGLLAAELLGWTTVCAVERDAYAAQVLAQRQNDGVLQPFPIWSDVSSFDGRPWRGIVDVVSGGFPCQDISIAGKGAGIDGERSGLWAQMARIIGEVQPRFVLVENSPVLTARGLGRVLGDLATLRYDAEWGVVSAADVKAPHKRERLWIVAYANCARESQQAWRESEIGMGPIQCGEAVANTSGIGHGLSIGSVRPGRHAIESGGETLADADSDDAHRGGGAVQMGRLQVAREAAHDGYFGGTEWPPEPAVGRMAHGVAHRVDRLTALGNGQVPRVAATAWRLLSGESSMTRAAAALGESDG